MDETSVILNITKDLLQIAVLALTAWKLLQKGKGKKPKSKSKRRRGK